MIPVEIDLRHPTRRSAPYRRGRNRALIASQRSSPVRVRGARRSECFIVSVDRRRRRSSLSDRRTYQFRKTGVLSGRETGDARRSPKATLSCNLLLLISPTCYAEPITGQDHSCVTSTGLHLDIPLAWLLHNRVDLAARALLQCVPGGATLFLRQR